MSTRLQGRRILVTRPQGQADELCGLIAQHGGTAVRFPVLEIGSLPVTAEQEALIQRLHSFDVAFFVSPNAVSFGLSLVRARRDWPEHLSVATVGGGSERALREQGFSQVVAPQSGFDSEAVLALETFAQHAVSGRRILIFRGDGGRELLGNTLKQRGAQVAYLSCYHRACPRINPQALLERVARQQLDAITLTSSEGVRNLVRIVGEPGMALLAPIAVFTPHLRIAAHAREAGFTRIYETQPGDRGLVEALLTERW